jgi:hypothetical protein
MFNRKKTRTNPLFLNKPHSISRDENLLSTVLLLLKGSYGDILKKNNVHRSILYAYKYEKIHVDKDVIITSIIFVPAVHTFSQVVKKMPRLTWQILS